MMEIGERTVRMFFNAGAPGIGEVDGVDVRDS
jgi:hypothetical protein